LTGDTFFDNPEEILISLKNSDVISIFFPYLKKTILIDKRTADNENPTILLTDMVRTPRERVQSLQKLRPNLPNIENILLIPWTRYIISLKDSGVWNAIYDTLNENLIGEEYQLIDEIFKQLLILEKRSLVEVIKGTSFKTVWEKPN
tara:strand:- start:996 stop:1436 length:441 start_codon:yes stop_codon:yes gene_type:complete